MTVVAMNREQFSSRVEEERVNAGAKEPRRKLARVKGVEGSKRPLEYIIGESPAMQSVKVLLLKIARSPASTVLLTGESGTGKDLAAKVIHSQSRRAARPLMNITCSALPETLLESELFGHERGAFTDARTRKKGLLEHAHGGTVFLDEIGEMEMVVQAKLLRFLEEKTLRRVGGSADVHADVRVIAATNVHLRDAVLAHSFREDLYYRLAVLTVHLPPLRERGSDLELLIDYFIERFNREFNKSIQGLTPGAMRLLNSYSWPGNVRELRNVVERAVLLADKSTLDVDDFQIWAGNASETSESYFWLPATGLNLRQLERSLVQQALERCKGNQTRAAALLGINRDQIRYRIEKFGLAGMKSRGKSNGDGSTLDDDNGGSSSYTDRSDDE